MKKRPWVCKRARRRWKSLKGGKRRGKCCNSIIISKIKDFKRQVGKYSFLKFDIDIYTPYWILSTDYIKVLHIRPVSKRLMEENVKEKLLSTGMG